ncbi:MAG: DUF4835 family protein [Bacteroidota bacterium]
MMIRKLFIILFLSFISGTVIAQELRCNVQVNSSQIQGTNKEVFRTLQKDIYEFVNERSWTDDKFENQERIECKILLNLKDHTGDEFKGEMQISSNRPVYNSSYNTTLIRFKDENLKFAYKEGEPLEFDINTHKSNLTSLLAYYAYIIIGLDYDSFSFKGGDPYFKRAQDIVNNAQNASYKGWKAHEDRKNRYWLVNNLLDNEYDKVREFSYEYHRNGLDKMHKDLASARENIAQSLDLLKEVYREKPDSYMFLLSIMLDAKADEFVNVFSESPTPQAKRVYEILAEIDPSRSDKYEKITQN